MKISRLSNPFSFCITSSEGKIFINDTAKTPENISVFLAEQAEETKNLFHWAGEYEVGGVAIFLQDIGSEKMIGKVFTDQVRIVFLSDEGLKSTENIIQKIGNTDVLVFEKGENGLTESETKKLLEEIDPRAMIAAGSKTVELFKKMALPVVAKEEISISHSSLPTEHTEYYSL
jgi:hypothetical protein